MATVTANTGSNNWNTNGAWVGAVQPTAADDVVIPASAVVTIPTAITALGRSCTVQASGTLAFASTTAVLTLGDATAGAGNVAFSNAGTITLTGIGTINFVSTAASSTQTITTGGATMPNLKVNTGATTTIQFTDNVTQTGATFTLFTGLFDSNSKTWTLALFDGSNGAGTARTATLGTSQITLTNTGTNAFLASPPTGMVFTANTATITFTGGTPTINIGAGFNFNGASLVLSGNGAATLISGTPTCANFTRTNSGTTTAGILFSTGLVCTGTFTVTGNSVTNRILVQSNAIGASRTITAATVSITNVDFTDITGAGAASPFTGTSLGNFGNNSGITFDNAVTQTWSGNTTGNWSTAANWTSRVPLPQDNVTINGLSSGTITADMPRLGANIDFTGSTGTLSVSITIVYVNGNLTLATGMTASATGASNQIILAARTASTMTNNGVSYNGSYAFQPFGTTCTIADAISSTGTNLSLSRGTVTFQGNVTCKVFIHNSALSTSILNMGSNNFTLTGTGTVWNFAAGGVVNSNTSTITITDVTSTAKTFAGGGATYNNLTYSIATVPSSIIVTGANTFNTINIGSGRVLTMPSSTTNTVNNLFNATGVNNGYEYLPGVVNNYISTPDSVPLSITGDMTIDINLALDVWIPATINMLAAKWQTNQISYAFWVDTAGRLFFQVSTNGTAGLASQSSTVATGISNGTQKWVRISFKANDGSGNRQARFYTSPDGTTWTQLGTTVTTSGTAAIFDSTAVFEIGTQLGGTSLPATGKFYEVKVYNSDLQASSGTPVFDSNLATKAFGANTFTESSSNAATVTINGALAQAGDGRILLNSSTPGTKATLLSPKLQSVDYFTIQDSNAPAIGWYAGTHSVSISNNSGWIFTAPPALSNNQLMLEGVG